MLINRIILGTANFAKPYHGVQVKDVDAILQYCKDIGVWAIDTATAYGTQDIEYPLKIVKLQKGETWEKEFPWVLMSHGMDAYDSVLDIYEENEKTGYIKFVLGASIYNDDIKRLLRYATQPYYLQVPYSVLDRRFENDYPFFKWKGTKIHARSVFCGGEVLKKTQPFNALMFVLANQYIDKVVVGTESLGMLQDTLEPLKELDNLRCEDEAVLELRKDAE